MNELKRITEEMEVAIAKNETNDLCLNAWCKNENTDKGIQLTIINVERSHALSLCSTVVDHFQFVLFDPCIKRSECPNMNLQ